MKISNFFPIKLYQALILVLDHKDPSIGVNFDLSMSQTSSAKYTAKSRKK